MKNFININDFSEKEINQIIDAAIERKNSHSNDSLAKNKVLALIFEKDSTRTRISFDLAIKQLGGIAIMLDKDSLHLGKRETIADTARTISQYADIIMMRSNSHKTLVELADYASIPVINGLSDLSHPCQTIATLMTIKEAKGSLNNINIAWFGPISNVAQSLMDAANLNLGFNLSIYCPKYYQNAYFAKLKDMNESAVLGKVTVNELVPEKMQDVDVIYTDTWFSMGDIEDSAKIEMLTEFSGNSTMMSKAKADCMFMNCLPANRAQEVSAEVIDGARSYVWQEAQNRLHVQKAIILNCL